MTDKKIPFINWKDFPNRTHTEHGVDIKPTPLNIDVLVNKINELVVEINHLKENQKL